MASSSRAETVSLRRDGSGRRSLRSLRCQSVVITDKERSLLIKHTQDKKMSPQHGDSAGAKVGSKGFVRSMCKFYSDIIGGGGGAGRSERRRGLLDRSASFSAVKETVKEGVSSMESVSSDQCLSSPVSSRSGSFRLNRSRSWRESRLETFPEDTPKRNSPTGQSVRSQDSGFSDSGEHIHHDIDGSYESQASSRHGSTSDEQDPSSYVTKINIETVGDNHQDHFLYRQSGTTPAARQKVTGTLDKIASLQEGFKIKLESEPRSLYNPGYDSNGPHFPTTNINTTAAGLLLRSNNVVSDQENPLSPGQPGPRFSTPVRASFRRRPQTMICLPEDANTSTPVTKRESRTRLKEIKSRRRWSANIDQDQSKLSPLSVNTSLNTKNSSQFSRNSLKADACCYEFRNQETRNSNLSPSVTALSLISPVERQNISSLETQSVLVDNTTTRLMLESYITGSPACQAAARSINTIFPHESVLDSLHHDTIIEHESSPPVLHSQSKTQEHGPSLPVTNSSLTNSRTNSDPVYEWWKDLFIWTEPECMTYLQSKPIPVSKTSKSQSSSSSSVSPMSRQVPLVYYPYETIRHGLENKQSILETFSLLKSHFSALNLLQMNKTIGLLTKQIRDFVYEHNLRSYSDPLELDTMPKSDLPGFRSQSQQQTPAHQSSSSDQQSATGLSEIVSLQEKVVLQIVDRVKLCAHRCQYTPSGPLVEMKKSIKSLEEAFTKFIELIISCEMKTVNGVLDSCDNDNQVVDAINTIINLGNEHSSQMYSIITKVGTIRSLMSLAVSSSNMEVSLLSLRAISSVCCTIEAVRELEQCHGIQTISSILTSTRTSLTVKVEAAGVLAQITSPWIADNHSIAGLKEQVPSIVEQLTKLTRIKAGDDTFLLVSAALANLTFMESQAVISMQKFKTAKCLMKVVTDSPFTSLFAKDQVVTVLANLANREECRADILACDGLCFLISLLSTNPENTGTPAETAAAERVLKKTAIALSRLCSDPVVCHELIKLRGLNTLVALVKDGALRNYNDAVLVACLAVLRRVAHHCGHDVFDNLEARDLIDPKLMDSFLEYSSKQESYV